MIKDGGSTNAQKVSDAYILNNTNQTNGAGVIADPSAHMGNKVMKKNIHNSNFNQSKYIGDNTSIHHNQS